MNTIHQFEAAVQRSGGAGDGSDHHAILVHVADTSADDATPDMTCSFLDDSLLDDVITKTPSPMRSSPASPHEPFVHAARVLIVSIALLSLALLGHAVLMLSMGEDDLTIPEGDEVTPESVRATYLFITAETIVSVFIMGGCYRALYAHAGGSAAAAGRKPSNALFLCMTLSIVVLFFASLFSIAAPIAYMRICNETFVLCLSCFVAVVRSVQLVCFLRVMIVNPKVMPADPLLRSFVLSIRSDKSL